MVENKTRAAIVSAVLSLFTVFLVIILPLSFSYLEYYDYGLLKDKITGKVNTNRVYPGGRHFVGPASTFIKYQGDAHFLNLGELSVFSASDTNSSIGLEFVLDVTMTYFLIEDEVGKLHQEMASAYKKTVENRVKTSIKNEAIFVSFNDFFQSRIDVESRFRQAVVQTFEETPPLHCILDQFHLGRIQIPDTVYSRQLESALQNEKNDREKFLQQAQIQRQLTEVEVNKINLDTEKLLRTTEAEASLTRVKAIADAEKMKSMSVLTGLQSLFQTVGIEQQNHKLGYSYIRALNERDELDVSVGYLQSDAILKTTAV